MTNLLVCAGKSESFEFAKSIGIGLIETAITLTNILTKKSLEDDLPKQIIFVGTAGIYKKGEILEIYESSRASNLEISKLLNLSYSPLNLENPLNVSRETSLTKSSNIVINSSNFITQDKNLAAKFYENGFDLENMEFYSILSVANFFKIKCKAVVSATNFCDENAHKMFIKNHAAAKEKLKIYIKEKGLIWKIYLILQKMNSVNL